MLSEGVSESPKQTIIGLHSQSVCANLLKFVECKSHLIDILPMHKDSDDERAYKTNGPKGRKHERA